MKIKSNPFKHGVRMIVVEATVEGEASGQMLVMATESIKTAVAGALDAAGKRLATAGLSGDAKATALKGFKRDTFFASADAVVKAFADLKAPGEVKEIVVADAGAWTGSTGGLNAERKRIFDVLVAGGMAEAAAAAATGYVMPAPTPSAATTPAPTTEGEEGEAN